MSEKSLRCLEIDTLLSKHRREPMAEGMKADPFCDSYPLQRWPYMPPEDHVRRNRLRPVLCNGWKQKVFFRAIECDQSPFLQLFNHTIKWSGTGFFDASVLVSPSTLRQIV
jgi:hypothetical protein